MFVKILNESLYNLIFNEWGTPKTFKVVGFSIACGAIGAVVSASIIENKPKIEEKEND